MNELPFAFPLRAFLNRPKLLKVRLNPTRNWRRFALIKTSRLPSSSLAASAIKNSSRYPRPASPRERCLRARKRRGRARATNNSAHQLCALLCDNYTSLFREWKVPLFFFFFRCALHKNRERAIRGEGKKKTKALPPDAARETSLPFGIFLPRRGARARNEKARNINLTRGPAELIRAQIALN